MELSDDQIIEKFAKQRLLSLRKTIAPYECEWTCTACGYNVIRRKNEVTEIRC